MTACRQNRKSDRHGSPHMKKGETVDHHIVLVQAMHLREAPGCMNLITMRQADELGPPRCAAGMEKRTDRFSRRPRLEFQSIITVPASRFGELDHRSVGRSRLSK